MPPRAGRESRKLGHAVAQSEIPDVLLQGLRRLDTHSPARCTTYESTVRVAAGFA
jgi:hypothetical protein